MNKPSKSATHEEVETYANHLYNNNTAKVLSYLRGWFNSNFGVKN